ncbi:conserved hypothetical protein [Gloeothece citriformis PCC 7424]|uniref:Uncharacterized protein n=1 Tax=Gloeothece citriformis (strain PCC 7424) TaxID=65393 RepID=B7KEH9_GLOC7|nr:hypothetical protein [Gloeothece citriformis]ACK73297.1 conserved hypothetical protein [Gloeothece citriformis PCC 7424]
MPGGHASHKGHSTKPNTNAENQLDLAADPAVDPQDLVAEEFESVRAKEAPQNEKATQRPEKVEK